MFDIGISEIAVIAVVALVVIGPERLPKVARTIGTLMGRAQRYVNDVKAEVNREMELEELRKLQTQMQDAARGIQEQVSTAGAEMQSAVHDVEKQLQEGVAAQAAPAEAAAADPAEAAAATLAVDPAAALPLTIEQPPVAEAPGHPTGAVTPSPETPHAHVVQSADAGEKPSQSSLFPEQTVR